MKTETEEIEIVSLPPYTELRFLMNVKDSVTVEISDGLAYSFYWELPYRPITFQQQPFPITSFETGCKVKISGTYISYYISPLQIPQFLENVKAEVDRNSPPVICVVGVPGVGKTSLCKSICNFILRNTGKYPIYVNADPDQALFSPPGCIGALPVTDLISNKGFTFTDPLVYFFGNTVIQEDRQKLYVDQMAELSIHIQKRRQNSIGFDGGVIIDFPSVTSPCISSSLDSVIESFGVSLIVVLANDKLHHQIRRKYPQIPIENLPMISGCIPLSKEMKNVIRDNMIKQYFYGDGSPELLPTNHLISKENVGLFSLGPLVNRHDQILMKMETPDPKNPSPVAFGSRLENCILALVGNSTKNEMWKQNALGFLHVINFTEEGQLNVLKPARTALPSSTIIASLIKWTASQ
ncbi:protein CLP1 [Histomonas meleagridis]|uniref:protein CLP1-like n=1 Tax=Histomonas meleagridis TaxID=135588 RepID=UPI00355A2C2A|nr:protein CLP1 [Histomonas meleagridis]KAH0802242.1 protein CLP1-like [Histomonas meleagridis]